MCKTDIKIVGVITDEKELDEIRNILNVFAYERRMKDYMSPIHTQLLTKKLLDEKKLGENKKFILSTKPHILVKGLC